MKKVLFATTALIATAGVAAADVSLSGAARIGLQNEYTAGSGVTLDHRVQLDARGSVETDGGTSFSVHSRMRVDDTERADGFNAPNITIKSGGVTVSAGNTASAAGARTNVFASGTGFNGDFGLYDTSSTWYSSTGAAGMDRIRLDFAMGTTVVSVSGDVSGDERLEIGVSGQVAGVKIGAAMSDDEYYAVDVNAAVGDATIGVRLTSTINGAYFGYTVGSIGVQAYASDASDWGVGMTYDLGGATFGAEFNETGAMNATIGFTF